MEAKKPVQLLKAAASAKTGMISRRHLKLLEGELNTDRIAPAMKKQRPVELERSSSIEVSQKSETLPPTRAVVGRRRYCRTYSAGNPSSETLVRKNFRQIVSMVQEVVANGLRSGSINKSFPNGKRELSGMERMCLDFDGIGEAGFSALEGRPLRKGKAFMYMVRQFFKDEDLALKVCTDAIKDFDSRFREDAKKEQLTL